MRGLRAAFFIASVVSAGLAAGRAAAKRALDQQQAAAIETATEEARRRIQETAQDYIARNFRRFAAITAVKAAALLLWSLVFWLGATPAPAFSFGVTMMLTGFVLWDAVRVWPLATQVLQQLHRHRWRPKRALSELIAARVYAEALTAMESRELRWWERAALWAAGEKPAQLSARIAGAVAEAARLASWRDLRPFLLLGAIKFGLVSGLYAAMVALLLAFS